MLFLISYFIFTLAGIYMIFPDKKVGGFIPEDWKKIEGVILEVNRRNLNSSIERIKVKFVTEKLEWIIGYP